MRAGFLIMPFGDAYMMVKDAVAQRFRELCAERGIRTNELANLSLLRLFIACWIHAVERFLFQPSKSSVTVSIFA